MYWTSDGNAMSKNRTSNDDKINLNTIRRRRWFDEGHFQYSEYVCVNEDNGL
mgnify:CR=1 FL=1